MSNGRRHNRHNRQGKQPAGEDISTITGKINFQEPSPDLFDGVASQAARIVGQGQDQNRNKNAQIRRFYDELVMWDMRVNHVLREDGDPAQRLKEYLPFIRMMNAKAAYADGRKLVDRNFKNLLSTCLQEVKDPQTLSHCRTFFEAFMGFYKGETEVRTQKQDKKR